MPGKDEQNALFDMDEYLEWKKHWRGMPEFSQEDLEPWKTLKVHFNNRSDLQEFSRLVGQNLTDRTQSIWHPEAEIGRMTDKRFVDDPTQLPQKPQFPLYIISKGRYDYMHTSRSLSAMRIPHHIVVEASERELYERAASSYATILVLDKAYQYAYDTADGIGFFGGLLCAGPARNYAWDHSVKSYGSAWHWVMDDNIDGFYRLYGNIKTPCLAASFWRAMEDFVLRYENVVMGGPNYFMFASRKTKMPAMVFNTRIYSCNLIRNDAPYRWRARHNEDTDLSLRILKDGWCTVQFNALLQMKLTTQTIPGGNTEAIYDLHGTDEKSNLLAQLHPDVAEVTERWGRVHHYVDYSAFKRNKPRLRAAMEAEDAVDNFGMVLQDKVNGRWVTRTERDQKHPATTGSGS